MRGWGRAALAAIAWTSLAGAWAGSAGAGEYEYVGLDPYNRPVYGYSGPIPTVPLAVSPPTYRRGPGEIGGPLVAGPLYYATPSPPVPGVYHDNPALAAGAILAYDLDAALAAADGPVPVTAVRRSARPAPFTGPWYRWCEARYRSFDADSGTYQPSKGPRRLCR